MKAFVFLLLTLLGVQAQRVTVPSSPPGPENSVLASDGSTFFSRGAASSAYFFDDWLGAGIQGQTSWASVAAGSGSNYTTNKGAARPGVGVFATTTGTTATASIVKGTVGPLVKMGGGRVLFRGEFMTDVLSDGSDTFTVRFGFTDGVTVAAPANGIFFDYTHSVNSGKWRGVVSIASSQTASSLASSAPAVVAGTWYNLAIVVAADGQSVEFFVNGTTIGTVTTDLTLTPLGMMIGIQKSAGANDRRFFVDWNEFHQRFTTPR